jgi:hypothetical protein
MPFESVFSGKCFSTSPITEEWFFSCVRFPMPFKIMLAVKGQGTQVAAERPLR